MKIKILGDTDQSRGKAFENLMVSAVLDHLGYTDFQTNIRPAAMELDIEASHKTKNKKILCLETLERKKEAEKVKKELDELETNKKEET